MQIKTEIDGTDVVFEDFISHDGLVFFLIKSIPIASHSVQISVSKLFISDSVSVLVLRTAFMCLAQFLK